MNKKRFLRDNTLNEMLDEIRAISNKISNSEFPALLFSNTLLNITEMYETNKVVLERLEDSIEKARQSDVDPELLDELIESAAHVQLSLVSVHRALKDDVSFLVKVIKTLKDNLDIETEDV